MVIFFLLKLPGLYGGNYFDVFVNSKGGCWGYPCPLAIRIFSREFFDRRYNGYYLAYHPMNRTYCDHAVL